MAQYQPVLDLSDLDGNNGFRLNGVAENDLSGLSVSSAGDMNGDGFDDVIVGALLADPNGEDSGASYVVFGKASGFSATLALSSLGGNKGFRLDGAAAGDNSGRSVSSAGDVNGDGFDDLIVGAYNADPNGSDSGASYVVFGKASGFGSTFQLSSLNGTNGFRLDGAAAGDNSGRSVSSAGDVNGDGFADLIVGAYAADPNGSSSGASYVVFGKASGFDPVVSLIGLNGTNGFRLDGVAASDQSGGSVSSAGDVNGDGFDDLIIGALLASPNVLNSGASYVVFGKASGFSATLALSALDGNDGFRLDGAEDDFGGGSVSSAGDVNGDGFDDLIVGAYSAEPNGAFSGASYVVFGKAAGFGATLALASLNGSNGFRLDGAAGDVSGYCVSSAGDVNGDGFADLLVGARFADPNGTSSGSTYVVFGKASGFSETLQLSSLDGNNGFRLDGVAANDESGFSVSSAGDVNGDGFADLIVGSRFADPNGSGSGASYVIFGGKPGEDVVRTGTGIANTIRGGDFDDELSGLAGNDQLIAYAGDDLVRGGSGNDRLDGGADTDELRGGSGNDTMSGGTGSDIANGGSGNDTLDGDDGNDTISGGDGTDTLNGGNGDDRLDGGDGKDTLNGGVGVDRFVYGTSADSTSVGFDTVKSADFAADKWDVASAITKIDPTIAIGALSGGSFDADLAAAADPTHFKKYHAVLFTPDAGGHAGKTFLLIDQNGVNGYQAGVDLAIELKTAANLGNIDAGDFI